MPKTLSKMYIHHVSAVKYRNALILPSFEKELHQYIIGIIRNLDQIPIQVNGMCDHIHIAARLRHAMCPAEFVQKVKSNSSRWINENDFLKDEFKWQVGGASFSVSETHVKALRKYIINQKAHHKKVSFKYEFLDLLHKNDIEAEDDDLPEFFEELFPYS